MTRLYYQLQRDCRLRRRASLVELAPLLAHPQVGALLSGRPRAHEQAGPGPVSISCIIEAGGEPLKVTLDAEEISRRLEWLRRMPRRCKECPADRHHLTAAGEQTIGCIGVIHLPLARETEQALLSVVDALLENSAELEPTVTLPVRFIWDNGLDGEEIRALRKRSDLFASPEPVEARIGPFLQKQLLNTDQLLSLFFLPGVKPRHYLHMFAPFAMELVSRARSWSDALGSDALAELIPFFETMALASDLDVELQIIYLRDAAEAEQEAQTPPPRTPTVPPSSAAAPEG